MSSRRLAFTEDPVHVNTCKLGAASGATSAPAGAPVGTKQATRPLSPVQPRPPPAGGIVVPTRTRQDGQQTPGLSRGPGPIGQGTAPRAAPAARGYSYAIAPHGLSKLGAGGRAFLKCQNRLKSVPSMCLTPRSHAKSAGLEATERPYVEMWTCHRFKPIVGCIE